MVVPATDDPATLAGCLDAIHAADDPADEVIVIERPKGSGPAHARNLGIETAAGELILFVDSDVLLHADAFRRIRDAFAADRGLTALFGSYDDRPLAPGIVSQFRNLLHHHIHQSSAGPATTFWAGLGAVRRDALLATGGFDAQRFPHPSVEDIELGMRLVAAGGRIELDPALQGTHLKGWSAKKMVRTDLRRRAFPWAKLLVEQRDASSALNLGWRHRISAGLSVVGAGALALRRPRIAAGSLAGLLGLNRDFYLLLLRRRGPAEAAAGVGLHALHHLAAVAAVPLALAAVLSRVKDDDGVPVPAAGRPRVLLRELRGRLADGARGESASARTAAGAC